MPTFVIHAMDQSTKKLSVDAPPVRVGRDPTSDIVVPGQTASREHAVFMKDAAGRWYVGCVSETNPITVNGRMVKASAPVDEGSEVVVGTECLIIFSRSDAAADQYFQNKGVFNQRECQDCGWSGMLGIYRRDPVCPKCGSTKMESAAVYRAEAVAPSVAEGATHVVETHEAMAFLRQIRDLKFGHLERVDKWREGRDRKLLPEDRAFKLGRGEGADYALHGFVLGSGVRLQWDGHYYVAESDLFYPAMRVNGEKAKRAKLASGDVVEVGANRFRFVTE